MKPTNAPALSRGFPCVHASLTSLTEGVYQLCLTIGRAQRRPDELAAALDRFQAASLQQTVVEDIKVTGLQNWSDPDGTLWSALYFSVLPCEDGISENGNGIAAFESAAYAEIWARYASI